MKGVVLLDARGSVVSGAAGFIDRAVASRAMAAGLVLRRRRVTYLPVTGGLLAAGATRPARLRPFVPLAELVLAERARLARDLHDSVVQTLYGISLGADTASELMHGNPAHAEASLTWIKETATAGLTDLRAIILRLRSDTFVDAGLAATLRSAFATTGCWLELDEVAMSPPVEEALYRIALEALGNAARHAEASQVTVRLTGDDRHVVLEVADNGVGFTPSSPSPGRLGLRSMRERAELLGGTLDVSSAPGAGTAVRAALPAG